MTLEFYSRSKSRINQMLIDAGLATQLPSTGPLRGKSAHVVIIDDVAARGADSQWGLLPVADIGHISESNL